MKNRPEISYLTILGLSLTVVMAVCRDDGQLKNNRLRVSHVSNTNSCETVVRTFADVMQSAQEKSTSFIFCDSLFVFNLLTASYEVVVDISSYLHLPNGHNFYISKSVNSNTEIFPSGSFPDWSFLSTDQDKSDVKFYLACRIPGFQTQSTNLSTIQVNPVRAGPMIA
jgi:hypothetical protein